jgi:hypothetical protein
LDVGILVANPAFDGSQRCLSMGELRIVATPTAGGGAFVRWDGHERDPVTCLDGPEIGGSAVIESPCCERVVDVHFPTYASYFRVAVRSDVASAR